MKDGRENNSAVDLFVGTQGDWVREIWETGYVNTPRVYFLFPFVIIVISVIRTTRLRFWDQSGNIFYTLIG